MPDPTPDPRTALCGYVYQDGGRCHGDRDKHGAGSVKRHPFQPTRCTCGHAIKRDA